jgi:hypothetical protein
LSHEVALTPHPPLHILHELLLRSNDRAWANDAEPADRLFGYETKRERETERATERQRERQSRRGQRRESEWEATGQSMVLHHIAADTSPCAA